MSTDELNVIAANNLLDKAMVAPSMSIAELFIRSAHRLEPDIDVNLWMGIAQDAYLERVHNERSTNNG